MSGEVDAPEGDVAWALAELQACRSEILALRRALQGRTVLGDTLAMVAAKYAGALSDEARGQVLAAVAGWQAS